MGYEKYSDEIAQQLDPNSIEGSLLLSELESDIQEELNQLLSKRFAEIQGDMKLANEGTGIGMTLNCALRVEIYHSTRPDSSSEEPEQLPLLRTFSTRRASHVESVSAEERVKTRSRLLNTLGLRKS
jgi:hypothetical protein